MSELTPIEDLALQAKPWLAKTVSNQVYLLKYAHVGENALFLVSTLEKVYLETLSPSRLISRASASSKLTQPEPESFSLNTGRGGSYSQSLNAESQNREAAIRSCLTGLEGLFSPGDAWDDVDIDEGDEDSFYDLMLTMSSDKYDWSIKLNKLHDSEALGVIRDHILNPLIALSGCLIDRLAGGADAIPDLQKGVDTSASTAARRLAPLLKNTMNKPVLQTSLSRWNQIKQGSKDAGDIIDEYPSDVPSPSHRPLEATSRTEARQSETPPPKSPDFRPTHHSAVPPAHIDLSPAQAQMSADLEMRSFSPVASPLPPGPSIMPVEQPQPDPLSEDDWNSDMTEPESDDEEAAARFEMARERVLAKRARMEATRTQGPVQDEIPDTPDQVDDSGVQLSGSVDRAGMSHKSPPSPGNDARHSGKKRKSASASPSPRKKARSSTPGQTDEPHNLLEQTESQKHEAAQAMRNALHKTAGTQNTESAPSSNAVPASARGRISSTIGTRGRGRGRGRSVW